MRIFSEKVKYGIAALFELAKKYAIGSLRAQEIADAQNIPKNFLIQLLIILKKAGFVESIRGARGGYRLSKPPRQIIILEIIEALEGDLTIVEREGAPEALNLFWTQVEKDFHGLLNISLEEIINRSHEFTFEI